MVLFPNTPHGGGIRMIEIESQYNIGFNERTMNCYHKEIG